MKINTIILTSLILITLSSHITCLLNYKKTTQSGTLDKEDVIATVTDKKATDALAFGSASNASVNPDKGFAMRRPEYVNKVHQVTYGPEMKDSQAAIESTKNISDVYYDGNLKLNHAQWKCEQWLNSADCCRRPNCGWCEESKSCIAGSRLGPFEKCKRDQFMFFNPAGDSWQAKPLPANGEQAKKFADLNKDNLANRKSEEKKK